MIPEHEDPLAERLFEAARREKPRRAARARATVAVAALERRKSFLRAKLAGAATLAVAAGVAFLLMARRSSSPTIRAEGLTAETRRTSNPTTRGAAQPKNVESSLGLASARPGPASTTPSASASALAVAPRLARSSAPFVNAHRATQEEELELVDRARSRLAAGDANGALATLDRYERTPSARSLGAEAALIRIQALAATGRGTESVALAKKFVALHPNSPLADRARSFAGETHDP